MPIDKHALRAWRSQLRTILNRDWDPIGGCPEDEYDTYNGKIAAMVRERATDADLFKYLEWAETEYMGLSGPVDPDRLRKVIAAIRTLGPLV